MRSLKKQEMIDVLYGCTVLGTGGGSSLAGGLALMQPHFEKGEALQLLPLEELPDDASVATPYMCGAPSASEDNTRFFTLPSVETAPSTLALKALEDAYGVEIFAVGSTELGGGNTAEALHAALEAGVPLLDADPAGRSVPELQHSTYYLNDVPIYPLSVATSRGETMVIQKVADDLRAEEIVRAIAQVSGNMVGVADHLTTGKEAKRALIPGMITFAENIGRTLRTARDSGEDVATAITTAFGGKILFRGIVTEFPWKTRDGFNYGEIHLSGEDGFVGQTYRIWLKNENIAAYHSGEIEVTVPDLICMVDDKGEPLTSPDFEPGQRMTVFALPAPEVWTSKEGLACLGPRYFGIDADYRPFTK